jgi:hypothetical protein
MFTAFNERNDFSYAFEKIRNAISSPVSNNMLLQISASDILVRMNCSAGTGCGNELGDWEYDLDTYSHCITVLAATSIIHRADRT